MTIQAILIIMIINTVLLVIASLRIGHDIAENHDRNPWPSMAESAVISFTALMLVATLITLMVAAWLKP